MSYKKKEDLKKDIADIITDPNTGKYYTRGKFLGKGGFARCFELTDPATKRTYAGKIVAKSLLIKPHQKQKMSQEISIHRSLTHKHIVGFHGYFEDPDNVYIILELCRRRSLMELHKRRKAITEPETRYFLRHLLHGVKHLHDHKIIHRDLKLGNLFINDDMQLKIGDFGLATRVEVEGERKKTLCGTPNYIAPEILYKKGHSYEVDIWSIGCILYTLLVGKPPFETHTLEETYERIKKNIYDIPLRIGGLARALIQKLLQKNPTNRPTVEEIINDEFMTLGFIPARLPTSCLTMAPRFDAHLNGSIVATRKPLLEINAKGGGTIRGEGPICRKRRCSKQCCQYHMRSLKGKENCKNKQSGVYCEQFADDNIVFNQDKKILFSPNRSSLQSVYNRDKSVHFSNINGFKKEYFNLAFLYETKCEKNYDTNLWKDKIMSENYLNSLFFLRKLNSTFVNVLSCVSILRTDSAEITNWNKFSFDSIQNEGIHIINKQMVLCQVYKMHNDSMSFINRGSISFIIDPIFLAANDHTNESPSLKCISCNSNDLIENLDGNSSSLNTESIENKSGSYCSSKDDINMKLTSKRRLVFDSPSRLEIVNGVERKTTKLIFHSEDIFNQQDFHKSLGDMIISLKDILTSTPVIKKRRGNYQSDSSVTKENEPDIEPKLFFDKILMSSPTSQIQCTLSPISVEFGRHSTRIYSQSIDYEIGSFWSCSESMKKCMDPQRIVEINPLGAPEIKYDLNAMNNLTFSQIDASNALVSDNVNIRENIMQGWIKDELLNAIEDNKNLNLDVCDKRTSPLPEGSLFNECSLNNSENKDVENSILNIDLDNYDCEDVDKILFEGSDNKLLSYLNDSQISMIDICNHSEGDLVIAEDCTEGKSSVCGGKSPLGISYESVHLENFKNEDLNINLSSFPNGCPSTTNNSSADSSSMNNKYSREPLIEPQFYSVPFSNLKSMEIVAFDCKFFDVAVTREFLNIWRQDSRPVFSKKPRPNNRVKGKKRKANKQSHPFYNWKVENKRDKNSRNPSLILKFSKL